MKILKTQIGDFGPFNSIEQLADRWHCDGVDYQLNVVGEAIVEDYVPPDPVPEPEPPPLPRHITVLAFRNRFTPAEKIAIDLASIDTPAAAMAVRQRQAAIRVNLADTAVAKHIDMDRPDTRSGVIDLEEAAIIGAGRALEILDAEIQPDERVP
jgi:hypothetical protein